jgi:hypothetical protein
MRYDHSYPVDATRQCEATVRSGRQCRNKALVQGSVRLSDGTTATVSEPKCALHGGQAAEANERERAARADLAARFKSEGRR